MNHIAEPSDAPSRLHALPGLEYLSAFSGLWSTVAAGYLSAGRLLHAIALVHLISILTILCWADPHPMRHSGVGLLGLLVVLTQLDARSRYQEYKQARDLLAAHGPNRRIFQSLSGSRCQRDAVLAAAEEIGYAAACRNHFIAAGYRWHHLLPEFVSHHPCFLFSPAFLRATFFAPAYRCRYVGRHGKPYILGISPAIPYSAGSNLSRGGCLSDKR